MSKFLTEVTDAVVFYSGNEKIKAQPGETLTEYGKISLKQADMTKYFAYINNHRPAATTLTKADIIKQMRAAPLPQPECPAVTLTHHCVQASVSQPNASFGSNAPR